MKRVALPLVFFLACGVACANPLPNWSEPSTFVTIIVIGLILFVEACVATLLLLFARIAPLRMLLVLAVGNTVLYRFLFLPVLRSQSGLAAEVVIVLAETSLIKLASMFEACQGDGFSGLPWAYALVVALAANAFSYGVGLVAL